MAHDPHGGVRALALDIKNNVKRATGLSCSIGVTPNKLLSKIASDLDKPDGLSLLTEADIPERIWPLPVRRINGIGPKAGAKLAALGIETIAELAAADLGWLVQQFGRSYGAWLHEAAHGRDDRPVVTYSEPVSMSRETTFERDLHAKRDRTELSAIFTRLAEQVAADLQRKGYVGRTIGELAAWPRADLIERFGRSYGAWLHEAANGRDERPVVTHSEPVSISRETTFERDLHAKADRAELAALFTRLCEQLQADLQRKNYVGRTVGIKLRFDDFRTVTRDLTLPTPVADATAIRRAAGECLKRVDLKRRLRLLGVRVGSLSRPGQAVPSRRVARPRVSASGAVDEGLPFES